MLQPVVQYQDGFIEIARQNMRDLNRERLRILAELGEDDNRPDLAQAAKDFGGQIIQQNGSFQNQTNNVVKTIYEYPSLQIRKASLEESVCQEDIIQYLTQNVPPKQSSVLTSHKEDGNTLSNHEEIFGNREGSPFPTYDLMAPRNSMATASLLEIDEGDVDKGSNSPTPEKIDMILLETNFDSKNFWPNKCLIGKKKERSDSPVMETDILIDDELKCNTLHIKEDKPEFEIVENLEDDCILDFDTSLLQRIDGVGSKPRTPSEEQKLKLKKKRNSKSFNPDVSRQSSAIDSDIVKLDNAVPVDGSSPAKQEPFWVNLS